MQDPFFTNKTFEFLRELSANNQREWFNQNKNRYEDNVRTPALRFIEAMAPRLAQISPAILASTKKTGGSLMRVYRDTRFSKDKTPYKTNIGIYFRHEAGKHGQAPGYYVHISPQSCFLGLGLHHPDSTVLSKVREAIAEDSSAWLEARNNKAFRRAFELGGERLKRPPQGYSKDDPMIEDLKRKDFVAVRDLLSSDVTVVDFDKRVAQDFKRASPFIAFLCDALELDF